MPFTIYSVTPDFVAEIYDVDLSQPLNISLPSVLLYAQEIPPIGGQN